MSQPVTLKKLKLKDLWRPIRPSRPNTQKRCPFHYRRLDAKVGSQEIPEVTNRQIWPWSTEWSRAKANSVLPRECTGHSKYPLPKKRRLYTWTSPDGQHWNQIDYILCCQRWRSSIQSEQTRPGDNCGSDHELLIAKFRLNLKKVGKTIRPFRYKLNQISCDYTVDMTNRFKGLDLIDRVPEELWMEVHDTVQEAVFKTIPKKKKCKKAK